MSVYISNALYLNQKANCPLIGYHSILRLEHISALNSTDSRPVRNLWSPDTATFWQGTGSTYLTLANPAGVSVDYVGMARHNLGSRHIAYSIQQSLDGLTFTDITVFKTVSNDNAIVDYFDATTAPFIRILFGPSIPSGNPPIIAHVRMGQMLILPQRIYVGHVPPTRHVARITNGSENGQFLGQIITRAWHQTSCKQEHLAPDFVRQFIQPFIEHCNGADNGTAQSTFFFAWRPLSYAQEVIYGWTEDNIKPENQLANGMMNFSFDIHGVA